MAVTPSVFLPEALVGDGQALPPEPLEHLRPAASDAMRVQEEIATRFTSQERTGAVLVRRGNAESALVDAERVANVLRQYRDRGLVRSVQSVDALLPSEQTQRARLARYNALPRAPAVRDLRESLSRHGFKTAPFEPFLNAFSARYQPRFSTLIPLAAW